MFTWGLRSCILGERVKVEPPRPYSRLDDETDANAPAGAPEPAHEPAPESTRPNPRPRRHRLLEPTL